MIKLLARDVHGALARGPRWIVRGYFGLASLVSRNLLPRPLQRRVQSSLCGYDHRWPALDFAPRRVRLGKATEVRLVPHLGEFDEQALFSRRLDYEPAVFDWLEESAATYDLIVEIGANVGIYSVFLDAVARRQPENGRPRLIAFEPSREAYSRLQRNLAANGARLVTTYQCAVGERSGLQSFFEPLGRLTNGSFVRSFAEQFSRTLDETVVVVIAAAELERWLKPARKALVKIDVEGFEPELLLALAPLLERYHPDVLIEVLPGAPEALAGNRALSGWDRFLVTGEGLRKEEKLYFSQQHFDWLLRWPGR